MDQQPFTPPKKKSTQFPTWKMVQCDGNRLTPSRVLHTAVVYNDEMIVFGGHVDRSNDISIFSFETRCWSTLQPGSNSPACLWGHSAVVVEQFMVVFGGAQASGEVTAAVWLFDCAERAWRPPQPTGGPQPAARWAHSCTLSQDKKQMLIFGGEGPNGLLNDLWVFDFGNMAWRELTAPGTPRARKFHTCVEFEGSLYLFGGSDGRMPMNDLYAMETSRAPAWRLEQPQGGFHPTERFGHSAVIHNQRLHLFGGLEVVPQTTNETFIPCVQQSAAQRAFDNGNPGDKICSAYFLNDWHKLSFKFGMWIRLNMGGHVPAGRWGHTAVPYRDRLFVMGGAGARGILNDMFEISLLVLATREDLLTRPVFAKAVLEDDTDTPSDRMQRNWKRRLEDTDPMEESYDD